MSDIDTAVVDSLKDSLKALDPRRPIREADVPSALEATGAIAPARGSGRSCLRLAIGQIDDLTRFLTIAVGDPAAGDHRQLVVHQIPSAAALERIAGDDVGGPAAGIAGLSLLERRA